MNRIMSQRAFARELAAEVISRGKPMDWFERLRNPPLKGAELVFPIRQLITAWQTFSHRYFLGTEHYIFADIEIGTRRKPDEDGTDYLAREFSSQ